MTATIESKPVMAGAEFYRCDMYYKKDLPVVSQFLGNCYAIHQQLCKGFPSLGRRPKLLFRTRPDYYHGHIIVLTVQSVEKPNWEFAFKNNPELYPMMIHGRNFCVPAQTDRWYNFTLDANTTKTSNGKRVPMAHGELDAWITKKGEMHGFKSASVAAFQQPEIVGYKARGGHKITLAHTFFRGSLMITDPVKFADACINGIGHGRSFGVGLLQIVD